MADIIRTKRTGGTLTAEQIGSVVRGVSRKNVSDAQIGAWLMAVYLRGMNEFEQSALTLAMRDSGTVLHWDDLSGPVLDKHSTGGVGDLTSLVLGPLVAACGGFVPMISGRGLGHTGGTLDKLESIPGYDVNPDLGRFREIVRNNGVSIVGQGDELAPADRRLYAIRDVTATVSCIPLIVSSILSKKLAEGLHGLVMDIKTGNGAFMTERKRASELARQICTVAETSGVPCTALMTDMGRPLADTVGNALELREAIDFLSGARRNARLEALVIGLGVEMLLLGGLANGPLEAEEKLRAALATGSAAERFARMVALHGGPADLMEKPEQYLAAAPVVDTCIAPRSGVLVAVDMHRLGLVVGALGGGRTIPEDTIDPRVGLTGVLPVGTELRAGDSLAVIHAGGETALEKARSAIVEAIEIADQSADEKPVVLERITLSDRRP